MGDYVRSVEGDVTRYRLVACPVQDIRPERTAEMVAPSRPVQVVKGYYSVPTVLL